MENKNRLSSFSGSPDASVPADSLQLLIEDFLLVCDISQHSERTIGTRRERLGKFLWFMTYKGYAQCGLTELRAFFFYLNHGHEDPGGRWGIRSKQSHSPPAV